MKGLILTYVITALACVGALRRPLIGLYVYVAFAVLRPQFIFGWAGDMSSLSLAVGVCMLAGWAINGFGSWDMGRGRSVVLLFAAFLAWFLVSASMAGDTTASYKAVVEFSKLALPFFVGVTILREEKDWAPLLWTIVLCQGYVSFENNLNYVRGFNTAANGFGGMDNNCFGVSLITVLGPAVALTISAKNVFARGLAALSAVLILHTILLTFSRGAMVGLLVVGAVAFVMMPKRPKYLVPLLIAVLLAARLTGPELLARYSTTFASESERDASAESRVALWLDCLEVIRAYPVFGIGSANWRRIASEFGWAEGKSAHSVWMETAAENGIPGALLLLGFFVVAAARLWPIARRTLTDENRAQVAVAAGVVLAITGFIVSGQFVSVPGLEAPYYVTMLGAAMLRGSPIAAKALASDRVAPMAPAGASAPARRPPLPPRSTAPRPGRRLLPDLTGTGSSQARG